MRKQERNYWQAYVRERVQVDPTTGCWVWQLCLADGYGRCAGARRYGLDQRAHRLAHQVFIGPIPAGLLVRHKCHNKPCCNPEHLRTGTSKDNKDDNRMAGLPLTTVTLTVAQVQQLKRLLLQGGHTQRQLGAMFGITQSSVSRIATGYAHGHIQGETS